MLYKRNYNYGNGNCNVLNNSAMLFETVSEICISDILQLIPSQYSQ